MGDSTAPASAVNRKNASGFEAFPDHSKALRQDLELLNLILDSIHHGVVTTDANGYITHFNKPYGTFLGVDPDAQIGKHVTEVIENTRMHVVAKTGIPEINQTQRIKGQNMLVQRIPIKKEGTVIAVFGQVMFKDVRDVGKLARKLSLLESKVELYESELISLRSTRYTLDSIVGVSDAIMSLKAEALKAAAINLPVLITGESGTGKELFAQAVHHASTRRLHPFIRINCAAIPKDLVESELFGYERGAFTGARSGGKPGKLELAHHGSLFLDEVGDLPLDIQPKLLRVLEEKEFEHVGGTSLLGADFRLIAATNQNLEKMLSNGQFRADLFYRLNVIPLHIPPLRERREDIIPLARHVLGQIAQDSSLGAVSLDPLSEEILCDHDWPGNARELCNVMERTLWALEGSTISPSDLPFYLRRNRSPEPERSLKSLRKVLAEAEKKALRDALWANGNNKARAARSLGIHRTLLYKKMNKHDLPLD